MINKGNLKAISPSRYYSFGDAIRHLERGGFAYLHLDDRIYRFSKNGSFEEKAKNYKLDFESIYKGNWQLINRDADSVYKI